MSESGGGCRPRRIHGERAVLAGLLAMPALVLAGTPINERRAADPGGQVEISNTAGSVTVSGWNRNEVEVTGELGEGSERLEFEGSGKVTQVRVILPKKTRHVEDTELVIRVPAASSLAINTVSADVRVSGVTGSQRLQTVSADIHTQAAGEDVECKTVSGDVGIRGSGAPALLTLTTVSGDATVERVAGEVNANTVSGDFRLQLGAVSRSRLRSTSGDMSMSGQLTADARIDVEAISGDIRVDFSGPVNAEFDVSTFNGDIRNCFGPKPMRTSEYAPGRELRFREGQGSGRVRIKTLNGDVDVCRR
jgi:DUF4097 and DUF4098 domain-containing protein YvlB